MPEKILCVVGTRPDAIKMAPVILGLRESSWADALVMASAQHRELLDQILHFFEISPDVDLDVMTHNQSLSELTAKILRRATEALERIKPSAVLVQGDTTTALTVALAAFYLQIPVGHVEAGLRTWDMANPFPEEANRVLLSKLARWHFAPTALSRENLLQEGIREEDIFVTGNTVIDALKWTVGRNTEMGLDLDIPATSKLVLLTCHRRENFGSPVRRFCSALKELAEQNPDAYFIWPVHPNPNVNQVAHETLGGISNVHLVEPLRYEHFVATMHRADLIITDSGGVQEEAPTFGTPVLLLREETERPEGVEQGGVRIVGTDTQLIIDEGQRILDQPQKKNAAAGAPSPYGDGQAALCITGVLEAAFSG